MLDNTTYDLMKQLIQEHKSLWRIQKNYLKDSAESPDVISYWEALAKDKEEHIKDLLALLKKHL